MSEDFYEILGEKNTYEIEEIYIPLNYWYYEYINI